MSATELSGVFAPVVTPFQDGLSPDPKRLIAFCQWLLTQNCGLAVFGTNSEANSLSVDERIDLLDHLADAGIDPGRMMPGTGCCAIPDTVRLSAKAASLGCGGVLMLPPFYYKGVSDDGLYASFAEVIERVGDADLKICLYHIPPVAQVAIPLSVIERLLKDYPHTVCGIKDSSGDWSNTQAMLQAFPDFRVFVGSEAFLLANMRLGGAGCISAIANVHPSGIDALYRNWQESDADARQEELNRVRQTMQQYDMIPALKAVVSRSSGDEGWARVRPPLMALNVETQRALFSDLDAIGFQLGFDAAA